MPDRDDLPDTLQTAEHRLVLLLILPIVAVASLVAVILQKGSHTYDPFDAVAYPLILAGVLLVYGILLLRPRATPLVSGCVLWGFSTYFLVKLAYLLFYSSSTLPLTSGLSETFFWTPAVFLFTFTTTNLRLGRWVNVSFLTAMMLLSVTYLVGLGAARDPHVLNVLAQLNFANLTCFLLAGVVHRLARRHATTTEHARTFKQLAHTDTLTGLPNRRAFEQAVTRHIAQAARTGPPGALTVLFLDLNGFKQINDTLGHEAGDLVLCRVAERLRATFRSDEVVARLSGDEFAAMVPSTDPDVIRSVVQRVEDRLAEQVSVLGAVVSVTASIGSSEFPKDGLEVRALLREADAAMYARKHSDSPPSSLDAEDGGHEV